MLIKKMILVMNIMKMTFIGRFVASSKMNETVVTAGEVDAVLVFLCVLLEVSITALMVGLVLVSVILSSVFIIVEVEVVIFIPPVVSPVGLFS